jgi:Glycoside hydrolase family 5 C-terminal domain
VVHLWGARRRGPGRGAVTRGGPRWPGSGRRVAVAVCALLALVVSAGPGATSATAAPTPAAGTNAGPNAGTNTGPASAAAASPGPAVGGAPSAGPPARTVLRAGAFPVDSAGRVLSLRGPSLPAGAAVDPASLAGWSAAGFTAARLAVAMTSTGTFPTAAAASPAGLDAVAAAVATVTGAGLYALIDVVPFTAGRQIPASAAQAGLGLLAQRFAGTPGLIGFEMDATAGVPADVMNAAVRAADGYHLLWLPAASPFGPGGTAVANDTARLLVGWADTSAVGTLKLVNAAEAAAVGWLYPWPPSAEATGLVNRPYLAATAGVPTGSNYAPFDRLYTASYTTAAAPGARLDRRAPTELRVPAPMFPAGYHLDVTGATVVSAPGSTLVCLAARPGATRVTVRLSALAAGAPPTTPPPGSSCPAGTAGTAGTVGTVGSANAAAARPAGTGAGSADQLDVAEVVLFPLIGALGMALLLGLALRGRRRNA